MAIEQIDKDRLPAKPKEYLGLSITDTELSTNNDDAYLLRILIDKVNELVVEINDLKRG
jgi:hypothetical protein